MQNTFVYFFVVFFSSRRRHPRCSRDWSSDVCSSDLTNNGPIGPGPFDPGGQPVPCYIGNQVHEAIAVVYAQAHIGQDLYVNHIPISGILQRSRITPPSGMSPAALAVKPDITNMTRRDLYEIK